MTARTPLDGTRASRTARPAAIPAGTQSSGRLKASDETISQTAAAVSVMLNR